VSLSSKNLILLIDGDTNLALELIDNVVPLTVLPSPLNSTVPDPEITSLFSPPLPDPI
jgi:hypothetical protein